MDEIRFIDLFSGIGGFRLGLQRVKRYRCVWSCDIDKYANQIYLRKFKPKRGEHFNGNIEKVNPETIPDFDLLCAGFPCQSFSVAGHRKGFEDTRGTLFFEICRIAETKRPPLLLLENVKGLLSHKRGETFHTILQSLEALGYWVEWQVLNSKYFGVPHNRPRVYIIGHHRDQSSRPVFPLTGKDKGYNPTKRWSPELIYVGAILSNANRKWLEDGKTLSRNFPQGQRIYSMKGIASSLNANAGGDGGKTGLYAVVDPQTKEILDIRRLTPVECERIQSFPDGWTEGISDTQRYKCLGNAVTTNVIEFLGQKIIRSLCQNPENKHES